MNKIAIRYETTHIILEFVFCWVLEVGEGRGGAGVERGDAVYMLHVN